MRRALASLLLALFSFPLIFPVLRADADPNLPSCCRREGKHRCSMESASTETASGLHGIQPKCSNYPSAIAIPGNWSVAYVRNAPSICASLLIYPSAQARTETQYRVSFSRSRQKRGPPALLS
jgi:hypothetical protein